MKKINYALLILTAAIMLFTISCGKDGAAGPKGDTGDKGSTGAVGPAGPAGANGTAGSMIYSGTTAPVATKGAVGDYYLNTTIGLLYGPKTSAGWGSGLSLKGATGATGAAGSTTLSGAGTPAPSLGNNGDYYLDKINYLLYGPKSGSGWGAPVNLRGPAGPQGPEGNANVKVDTFTVKSEDWRYTDDSNNNYYYEIDANSYYKVKCVEHSNSLITASLLNTGLVLVYFQTDTNANGFQWQPLPYSYISAFSYNWVYETYEGKVRLYFYIGQVNPNSVPPDLETYQVSTKKYKIVMISGSIASSLQQNHINVNKYDEVSKFLNIK
ncbi:hypothetical protein HDF23_001824 [Mucilaginibacter lappiensis]|uniref:Collagen triple helix repeat-containing protein n=1 Tax=Mucilaginibacter lappiensis TaxID=354630 RepID=A0ABR6PLF0_9SPHI|nr:collagen-like protein [Mucilaginibacter lappiensis]MBB6109081.1 hypothetical protein [Mucilaginibacter lappiensis]